MSGLPRYAEPVVGFDLDMTLVDTSAAMMVAVRAVNREPGVAVDVDACVRAMGSPQRQQLAGAVPAEKLDAAMSVLARAFLTEGLDLVRPLDGAGDLLAELAAAGGRAVVVTTRRTRSASACLRRCGLLVAYTCGGLSTDGKVAALQGLRAASYVGDHPLDMAAATGAGVAGIGVTTGFHDAAALTAAGAAVVFGGLAEVLRGHQHRTMLA